VQAVDHTVIKFASYAIGAFHARECTNTIEYW